MRRTFQGKRVLIYGMGISGQSACKLLHSEGACVSFYDDQQRFGNFYGCEQNPTSQKYDLVVVSPGIKVIGNEIISHFLMSKTPVISELDLGSMFCKGKIIGITGTNGKTTVTMLIGQILKNAGLETFVCGNIGLPLSAVCKETTKNSFVVCEVSNFQLELSSRFSARIAGILNFAPDHLDRHGSYNEYLRVKEKIISKKQTLFLNNDDEAVKKLTGAKKIRYFSTYPLKKGVSVKNNAIYFNRTKIMPISEVPLIGDKNLSNVLCAAGICYSLHVKPRVIRETVRQFEPAKHRLQYLGKCKSGADVIDDSKATNISSVEMALESLAGRKIVLLMGGLNKDCQFDDLYSKGLKFSQLIFFGQAREYLSNCARAYGYESERFETLKEACEFALANSGEGEIILLSPGCASFDEFSSYAVRGERFKEYMFEENQ